MKKKSVLLSLTAATLTLVLTPVVSRAGQPVDYSAGSPAVGSLYNEGELQLDLFGAFGFEGFEDESFFDDEVFGGGVGLNYYLTRNLGFGIEGLLYDTDDDPFGSAAVNLFLRFPIGDSGLAFYGYGGVGAVFDADKVRRDDFRDLRDRVRDGDDATDMEDALFEAHVGVGLEYRFSPNLGLFTDIRHTFVEDDVENYSTVRAGIRIAF